MGIGKGGGDVPRLRTLILRLDGLGGMWGAMSRLSFYIFKFY